MQQDPGAPFYHDIAATKKKNDAATIIAVVGLLLVFGTLLCLTFIPGAPIYDLIKKYAPYAFGLAVGGEAASILSSGAKIANASDGGNIVSSDVEKVVTKDV